MSTTFAILVGETVLSAGAVNLHGQSTVRVLEQLALPVEPAGEVEAADFLGRALLAEALVPSDEGAFAETSGRWTEGGRLAGHDQRVLAELVELARAASAMEGALVIWD